MTQLTQDWQLLRQYVDDASEQAFSQLVAAHVDMVYSAALRQVRAHQLAEEVTQIVFIILAKKAAKLSPSVILPAWLHKTTRYTAINVLRVEARRKSHERKAAQMYSESYRVDSSWNHLSPMLDAAIARLNDRDRASIMLRYFQQKTVAEVAQAMGISQDAAAMRISRAVDKLRATFEDKGVPLAAVALGGIISANSVHAAPPGLGRAVAASALRTIAGGASGSAVSLYNADAVIRAMAIAQAKGAAMVFLAVCALLLISSIFTSYLVVPLWRQANTPIQHHTNLLNDHRQFHQNASFGVLDYRLDKNFS
jgi:RNA polymerase sigma factor (sigma-70 family)